MEALSEAAARFGTPVYVIGVAEVAAAAARLEATFDRPWLRLYSLKANDLPAITSFLHGRGWGASVVSAGEWRHALAAGVPNESVAFEGLGKTDAQLELVVAEAAAGRPLRWLAIEPGRYLVGAAGWLVASVLHARAGSGRSQQVVLDAGMTEFIRPALYGSRHSAHALPAKIPAGQAGRGHRTATGLLDTQLEGPVCETTDSFGRHALPPLDRGDLVAIEQAGAYGASFTSRYNGRPAPAEILLWLDGTLQPCERPLITPLALTPAHAPGGAARSGR